MIDTEVKRRAPSKKGNPEIHQNIRKFTSQYIKNFELYISIVGRRFYTIECHKQNLVPSYTQIEKYKNGHVNSLQQTHVATTSYFSKLPIGVWLMADLEYLKKNLIISIEKSKLEIEINSAYLTDGVFFYSRQFSNFVTIGSPEIQEYVEKGYDTRSFTLNI